MLIWLCAILLTSCAADTSPTTYQGASKNAVPPRLVAAAIEVVERCVGKPLHLEGWRVMYAAGMGDDDRFICDLPGSSVDCGAFPPGCSTAAECPCHCSGLTNYSERLIVVADSPVGRAALKHELIHAGYGVPDHSAPEFLCQ